MNEHNREFGRILRPTPVLRPHANTGRQLDPVRDFFRRGDRGQYEGGPADRTFDSIPTWDLPERPQIVRTPEQHARRRKLMQLVSVFLSGCVLLLVAAAGVKSRNVATASHAAALVPERGSPAARPEVHVQPRHAGDTVSHRPDAKATAAAGLAEVRAPSSAVVADPGRTALAEPKPVQPPAVVDVRLPKPAVADVRPSKRAVADKAVTTTTPGEPARRIAAAAKPKPTVTSEPANPAVVMPATKQTATRAVAAFPDD